MKKTFLLLLLIISLFPTYAIAKQKTHDLNDVYSWNNRDVQDYVYSEITREFNNLETTDPVISILFLESKTHEILKDLKTKGIIYNYIIKSKIKENKYYIIAHVLKDVSDNVVLVLSIAVDIEDETQQKEPQTCQPKV